MPEQPQIILKKEAESKIVLDINPNFESFFPEEFRNDPFGYFESRGINIKPGEIKHDQDGRVREDPSSVKVLPVWHDADGNKLEIIGKKVNSAKGEVGESGDPFYEAKILDIINSLGLPSPRVVAKASSNGECLIVMEKVHGISWYDKDELKKKLAGYSYEEIEELKHKAEIKMKRLQTRYDQAGIIRSWKLKDMIFRIDFDAHEIIDIVPTDWERTIIDQEKLEKYKKNQ